MKLTIAKSWAVLLSLLVLAFSAIGVSPVYAATYTVTNLNNSGAGSLRQAITVANAHAGADTITFGVSGTIVLASKLPDITDAAGLTIDGTGKTATISGNHAVQVTVVDSGALLSLKHLTIANGNGGGGSAGAIQNVGTLEITNSTFSTNSATGRGGAIFNNGTLNITNSTFSGNSAATAIGGGLGGAIYNYDSGTLTITNSKFSGNSATGSSGNGGAVFNSIGAMTITNSSFSGNSADIDGGAVYTAGTVSVTKSTFSTNSAAGDGGGGIFDSVGTLNIANSTFSGNNANSGSAGGAIFDGGATLSITNSTFSGNSASGSYGGMYTGGGTLTLRNTIVANNLPGNCGGTITNGGNNIDDGTSCGWGSASGSMSGTNPLLGVLSGAPAYFPLNAGSPAINAGNTAVCAAAPVSNTSQNGITRPQGAGCDIGSFEAIVSYSLVSRSNSIQDGWVLETSETSGLGGTLNAAATTFRLGDDATKKQYRGILSFNTGAVLPDTAVITSATLWLKKSAVAGPGNPLSLFQGFLVDVKKGVFGTAALQASDFQATANKTLGPFTPALVSGWYSIDLTGAKASINKLATSGGLTQIRLRFKLDDNNNAVANYLSLFSGNAAAANRPQLVITYYLP